MSSSSLSNFLGRLKKGAASNNYLLFGALLIAGLAALPLWFDSGLLNTRGGGDSPFLLQRVNQLATALIDGHFPVRWMPDANYGYGYPFFNFYAPLSIFIATAFRAIGFSYIWAIQLSQILGFLIAAWATYKLAERWLGVAWAGFIASAAYTLAPFHMVNVYVRGDSLAEFWAMAFFPLLLLALDNLLNHVQQRGHRTQFYPLILLALSFAALILSHNISALIFTPFVLLYLILNIWDSRKPDLEADNQPEFVVSSSAGTTEPEIEKEFPGENRSPWLPSAKRFLWPALALALGLALAAWFWLPALGESNLAQLEPVTAGYFHFENHFRDTNLVQNSVIFNYDVAGGTAFSMGLVQFVLILAGLASIIYFQRSNSSKDVFVKKNTLFFILAGLIISTFMISSFSRPLWDHFPLLKFVQFPWRFLSIQAFFGALAIGGLGLLPAKRVIVPTLIILLLISGLLGLELDYIRVHDQDVTAEHLAGYEWFTGNIGTTVSAEYLPQTTKPRPFTSQWLNISNRDKIQILAGDVNAASLTERHTSFQSWELDVRSPQATVSFPTLYWAGWSADIDGQGISIWPAPGSGLITTTLPEGSHLLELSLNRTTIRWTAEILSLSGLIVLILLYIWADHRWRPGRRIVIALIVVPMIALILLLLPEKEALSDDLNWDFDQLAYLHHSDNSLRFNDGSALLNYQYSADQVAAGNSIVINLVWDQLNNEEVVLDLVSPAINRFPDAPIIVLGLRLQEEAAGKFELLIPDNAPAGLFLPRVKLPGVAAITSSGKERGELYLRPIQIVDRPEKALHDDRTFSVRPIKIEQRSSSILDLQLGWLTSKEVTQNYNFSLRLVDAQGLEITQFDNQPGYGFLPSSGWLPGMWVDDWLAMPIPAGLKQSDAEPPYSLVARLYDLVTGEEVLLSHLGQLDWQDDKLIFKAAVPAARLPEDLAPLPTNLEDRIVLQGYVLQREGEALLLDLYWRAKVKGLKDYTRFVHVVDSLSGEIITQLDAAPRNNTFPTSQWLVGSIVKDTVVLDITDLPSGEYKIFVGFYSKDGSEIVPLLPVDESGQTSPDGRILIPEPPLVLP